MGSNLKYYLELHAKRFGLKVFRKIGNLVMKGSTALDMELQGDLKTYQLLIDGHLCSASGDSSFESVNPSTGQVFAKVASAGVLDMSKAIGSARKAYDCGEWSELSVVERGIYLKRLAKLIRDNARELAELESADTGKTMKQTTFIDVNTCADTFDYFSNISESLASSENKIDAPVKSITEREPIGVVACIIPWNYPLIMTAWKLAPALMAGNTIIFKPSPLASVSIMRLAEIIKDVGFPSGVINIVATDQNEVANQLLISSDVDKISFTGGTETGRKIIQSSAETIKKLTLELGGKSPNIIFSDCDFDAAIGGTLSAIFMNQGQMCTAGSRLLVEESIYEKFLNRLVERTKSLKIGLASNADTDFGPVISREHRDGILDAINKAVEEGAKIECGGNIPEGDPLKNGFYIEPTILSNVSNEMTIAQEEVFGPVLSVMKFSDEQEALQMANDSKYGLAACLWTKDIEKANRVAKKLQCGTVWINTYGGFYDGAPFGGYKQSGFGRELGVEGLYEFTQTKHICTDQTPGGKSLVTSWF